MAEDANIKRPTDFIPILRAPALVLATGYRKADGIFVSCVPEFADVTIEDQLRTAVKLVIEPGATSDFSAVSSKQYSVRKENVSV